MRTKHLVGILVLLAIALPASPAHAGGVVSVCDEAHLRAALAGGGTVTFSCSGTITLTAAIMIAANTTIDGSGQDVTISGNHAVRVFIVSEGVSFNLNRLTVADGNTGYNGTGGGILNYDGTLTVSNSTFSGNSAHIFGGGIDNYAGTVIVSNSIFTGNDAYRGGGIFNGGGTLIVSNTTFSGNNADRDSGGGIYNGGGTVTVDNSTFSGNSAGAGGGIHNSGALTVSNSTFAGNSAYWGGGMASGGDGATVTVSNSTFSGNSASNGGGISNGDNATVTVSNSTFSGNSAYYYRGGGILNYDGTVTVSNSTFSGNSATYGSGGGIYNEDSDAVTTLNNTIVANSPTGNNCYGTTTDGGGNLSYPDTTCPGINADPMLGPLQDNGGPTQTMALGTGSAAIDAGIDAICAADPVNNFDQRGVMRPLGSHCDIGAVEQILEPAAVSLSALSARSLPSALSPTIIAGVFLAALVGVGVRRRYVTLHIKGYRTCEPNISLRSSSCWPSLCPHHAHKPAVSSASATKLTYWQRWRAVAR